MNTTKLEAFRQSGAPLLTHAQIAASLGCTVDQLREQFRRNAESLQQMLDTAERTGKPVNKYSADQLRRMVSEARQRAAGRD